jgi:hypothetical protein
MGEGMVGPAARRVLCTHVPDPIWDGHLVRVGHGFFHDLIDQAGGASVTAYQGESPYRLGLVHFFLGNVGTNQHNFLSTIFQYHFSARQPPTLVVELGVENHHLGRQHADKASGIGSRTGQMNFPTQPTKMAGTQCGVSRVSVCDHHARLKTPVSMCTCDHQSILSQLFVA